MNEYYLLLGKPLAGFLGNSLQYKGVDRDKTLYYHCEFAQYNTEVLIDNEYDAINAFESIPQNKLSNEDIDLVYVSLNKDINKYQFLGWDVSWNFENSIIAQLLDIPYWLSVNASTDNFKIYRDTFYKKLNDSVLFDTYEDANELISVISESSLNIKECEWLDYEIFPIAIYLVRNK